VAYRVLQTLGDEVLSVFSKKSFICKAYQKSILAENVDAIQQVLVEKSKRKDQGYLLPTTKAVLQGGIATPTDMILKYFIFERNMYGLLDILQDCNDEDGKLYFKILEELGLPSNFDIKSMSQTGFEQRFSIEEITQVFHNNSEVFESIVERGLLQEISSNGKFQVVKAFDLFNAFFDMFVANREDNIGLDMNIYAKDFFSFVGSMVISYCPVLDAAVSDIDSGLLRDITFVQNMKDFIYDVPLENLIDYDLTDLRILVNQDNE